MLFTSHGPCAGSAPWPRSLFAAARNPRRVRARRSASSPTSSSSSSSRPVSERGRATRPGRKVVEAQADRSASTARSADVPRRASTPPTRGSPTRRPPSTARLRAARAPGEGRRHPEEARPRAGRRAAQRGAALPARDGGTEMIGLIGSTDGGGSTRRGQALPAARQRQAPGRRAQGDEAQDAARRAARRPSRSRSRSPTRPAPPRPTRRRSSTRSPRSSNRHVTRPASAEQHENAALGAAVQQHDEAEAGLQAESDRIAAQLQSAGEPSVSGNGTFIWPVQGPITSGFGYRTDPITGAHGVPLGPRPRGAVRHADQGRRLGLDRQRGLQHRRLRQHDADQPRQRACRRSTATSRRSSCRPASR